MSATMVRSGPLCGMRGVAHRSTTTTCRVRHAGRVAGGAGSGWAGRAAAAAAVVKSGGSVEAARSRLRLQPRRRVPGGGGDAGAWVRRRWRSARASVGGSGGDDVDAETPVQSDEVVQIADSGDAATVVPYESKGWQRRYTMVRSSGAPGAPNTLRQTPQMMDQHTAS
jgi:hypothetical protein